MLGDATAIDAETRRFIKTAGYRAWLTGWLSRWVVQSWLHQAGIAIEDVRGVEWMVCWLGGEVQSCFGVLFVCRGRRTVGVPFKAPAVPW